MGWWIWGYRCEEGGGRGDRGRVIEGRDRVGGMSKRGGGRGREWVGMGAPRVEMGVWRELGSVRGRGGGKNEIG